MLGDDHQQVQKVLKEVGDQADKGHAPSVKDLRIKVQKLTPRKKKEPKRAPTSGKSKKRQPKPEPPPYEPTPDEQSKMDEAETKAMELSDSIRSGDVFKLVAKCDNGEKSRWLKIFEPFVTFYNTLERVTGYS
jgi:hypothetical protein